MTLKEVLIALADGKKIRLSSWPADQFIHIKDEWIIDEYGMPTGLTLFKKNWELLELFEEPTPTPKKKYVLAFLNGFEMRGGPKKVCGFLEDEVPNSYTIIPGSEFQV